MKTKKIRTYKRWRSQPDEKYVLEMTLYLSQKELENIRNTIFKMEEGS